MSIQVDQLTKNYGNQEILKSISFMAKKGEILGFLGPNGAGKTTTMKIITGFINPDSGTVQVCGTDIRENPILSRTFIGYLPEQNPLYGDMYIREFLTFAASLHGISRPKSIIDELIVQTGLTKEQRKKIKMLSKGYRQRVGLAQALLHDPEVLILDEPTSGLDPNQLEDIRSLIRNLGKEKTVVFSTHIMQEVQALCDRVIIISNGNLVVNDRIGNLEKYIQSGHERILAQFEKSIDMDLLNKLPGTLVVTQTDDFVYRIDCKSELETRQNVFRLAAEMGLPLIGLEKQDVSIENIFQALTKDQNGSDI